MSPVLRHGAPLRRITSLIDIAAHAQTAAAPQVVARMIDGWRRTPAPSPAFMLGGASAAMARAVFGQLDIAPCCCFAIEDAAAGPAGVLIKDSTAFHGETLGTSAGRAGAAAEWLNARAVTTGLASQPLARLFGADAADAASLLTDTMPRLWVLGAAGHDLGHLAILIPADAHPDAQALLSAAGLSPTQLLTAALPGDVIRAPRLLAPGSLRDRARYSPLMGEATRFWTARVRQTLGLPPPDPKRGLFLSPRDTAEPSGVADWQAIEAAADAAGLTVIHTASLSLPERITTFGEAGRLLGFDGAALIEACIFAPPGIAVCAIRGSTATGIRLAGLPPALGQKIGIVIGAADPDDPDRPATIPPETLQSALTALSMP